MMGVFIMKKDFTMIPISEGEYSTLLGMNGGCPESPDGKLLVYARKDKLDGNDAHNTEVWICNRELGEHRKVYEVKCGNHNGPSATFIDTKTIVFRGTTEENLSCFYILDIESCKLMYGPIVAKESHCAENGKYPFSISPGYEDKNPDHPEIEGIGIYELDIETGKIKKLVCSYDILDFIKSEGYTPTEQTASMSHVQYNPSANQVMMRLSVEECKVFGALGCVDLDTGNKFLIPDKPVHQLWFDDNTYMAVYQYHDGERFHMNLSRINRYTRDGKIVETLGGIGNHVDGSPDRKWFAGDSAYPGEDIKVFLYSRGEVEPIAVLDTHRFLHAVWKLQIHPNPSFSKDGKRVYFNRPISDYKTQAVYVDISEIVG
jgi:hypothetical protein